MQQDSQHKAQLAQYEDELARKRAADEHEKNRERNQELVGLQEQSVRKQEAERRRIQEQIEAERRATEQYKVKACKERCIVAMRNQPEAAHSVLTALNPNSGMHFCRVHQHMKVWIQKSNIACCCQNTASRSIYVSWSWLKHCRILPASYYFLPPK